MLTQSSFINFSLVHKSLAAQEKGAQRHSHQPQRVVDRSLSSVASVRVTCLAGSVLRVDDTRDVHWHATARDHAAGMVGCNTFNVLGFRAIESDIR